MKIKQLSRQSILKQFNVHSVSIIAIGIFIFFLISSYISADMPQQDMGIERVARYFTPIYKSKPAEKDSEIRWVQIDLVSAQKIDAIKLLPMVAPGEYTFMSRGFPLRFRIDVSDNAEFKSSRMFTDKTSCVLRRGEKLFL